jgi:hypothetical protein
MMTVGKAASHDGETMDMRAEPPPTHRPPSGVIFAVGAFSVASLAICIWALL